MPRKKCTCSGCGYGGPHMWQICHHWDQQQEWELNGRFLPCEDEECFLGCQHEFTQEDLLCDKCRNSGGISFTAVDRITRLLRELHDKEEPRQRVIGEVPF